MRITFCAAVFGILAIVGVQIWSPVRAQEPEPTASPSPIASAAVTPAASPAVVVATHPPESQPATMAPATATPALPEEGGPAGGVISGRLYVDADASGDLSPADGGIQGSVVSLERLGPGSVVVPGDAVHSDRDGYWERRSLPDGQYRVEWEPPIDPADYDRAIPPAITIVRDPITTVQRVVQTVEIVNGSRVSGINFGIPQPTPVFGGPQAPIQLPDTGSGGSGGTAELFAVVAGIAVCAAGVGFMALQRRRAR